MNDDDAPDRLTTRLLGRHEHRAALDLFRDAHHQAPVADRDWPALGQTLEPGTVRGAFRDSLLLGMQQTIDSDLIVPGGARVPLALHTRLAVRTGHTRQGVGRALVKAALRSSRAPLATLRASEGGIYGRFGFAVGTRCRDLVVDRHRARLAAHVPPPGGEVYMAPAQDHAGLLPQLYTAARDRTGTLGRPAWYEALHAHEIAGSGPPVKVLVHRGPEGDDGFARYLVRRSVAGDTRPRLVLQVDDMHYSSPQAWTDLWRALLNVELVDEVRMVARPLDEPVEGLFTDPRVCRTDAVHDETWLRLTDVRAALGARRIEDGEGVVIEVRDTLIPANTGCYRVGAGETVRTEETPQLSGSVAAWAAAWLGTAAPSALAATGAVGVRDVKALEHADRLFAVRSQPWTGSLL